MNKSSSLFQKTRWRLTSWYAGVISVLLTLLGIGVYEAIIHAHRITIKQELTIVAGTLHDNLQSVLKTSGQFDNDIFLILPNLCQMNQLNQSCLVSNFSSNYRINPLEENQYYVQFFNLSGELVAISGRQPSDITFTNQHKSWEIIQDQQKNRYLQVTYLLHTQSDENWGYLRVGRSLKNFDQYLQKVGVILLLGLPLGIILVGFSAWWLAGLAIAPIYQSYQQIQQFTADAAHELRTPLAAIRANIESTLMLPKLTEQESRETFQTLNRQNKRLSNLVADLLMLSRLDWHLMGNSSAPLKQEKVCLNDLISDIEEELASLALSGEITLDTNIKVNYPLEIQGDPEKIYRLLFNIVSNGIQYTLPHGKVTVTLDDNPQFAVIIVEDTGIGIDSQHINNIFNRFYRIDKARSRKQGGSGLGLSIAKAIAQAHHGKIEVKSQINQGTTMIIQLAITG